MAQPQNFLAHPANVAFAAAAQAVADALANNDIAAADAAMDLVRQHLAAVQAAGAAAIAAAEAVVAAAAPAAPAEEEDVPLDDDASTVLGDNEEPWEVFEDELPDELLHSVQHARHALELVRASADVSNRLKNRLYVVLKNTFCLFLGEPEPLATWRNRYEEAMDVLRPQLPAALLVDLEPHLQAFQVAFQELVDELHPLAQGEGRYDGFPALSNDIYVYVRRMLRIPEENE